MAQSVEHQTQVLRKSSSTSVDNDSRPQRSPHPPAPSSGGLGRDPVIRSSFRASRSPVGSSANDPSSTGSLFASTPLAEPDISCHPVTSLLKRYQPSKVFLSKCRTESDSLTELVKNTYHNEIKEIYNNPINTDLFIEVGEEPIRPLHKSIVASRAYKLFSALKFFRVIEEPIEKDIIVSELQLQKASEQGDPNPPSEDPEKSIDQDTGISGLLEGEHCKIDCSSFNCILPGGLISPSLLVNFLRRVYLDQDLGSEDIELQQKLIDFIKKTQPDLIKSPKKHSPNHRESFRTIQPDFDLSKESTAIESPEMNSDQLINLAGDSESAIEEADDNSQAISVHDESLTGSLLTRTETFELVAKSNPDSPSISKLTLHNSPAHDAQTDSDKGEVDTDASNTSAYAPTTRTGLKPKKFTTPVGLRSSTRSSNTPKQSTSNASPHGDSSAKSKSASANSTGVVRKDSAAGATSSTSSSLSSKVTDSKTAIAGATKALKSPSVGAVPSKVKQSVITRAQPISMERSQSPVAQLEKKNSVNDAQAPDDNEDEPGDSSLLAFVEPLTSDNLVAQMDKFSLVSHSKLADALSRLFVDGLLTDTLILVRDGKQIPAHKCILAARSAYLAEQVSKLSLSQGAAENSPSNGIKELLKIDLTEFSYATVFFSLMHIYSGNVKVPDDIELDELARLTHQLHVTTLRQVCMHNLRMNYCHFFHKPCQVCCVGVLKTLPLAWRYDYTDLYAKCLQWIGSHFASIFCLKEFSELKPQDLVEECYSATLSQLNPDNIIAKTLDCQKLLKNLPRVKWTEPIICLVGRLLEDFCHHVADNYEKILKSESFLNLAKNCWECEVLEENLLAAMNHLKPDSGCRTLIQLNKIECSLESYSEDSKNMSDSFANLVSKMRKYCERYLLKEATAVVHCSSWRHMSPTLQKRIKDQAILSTDFDDPVKSLAPKPKLGSMSRTQQQSRQTASPGGGSDIGKSPSNRSTPESSSRIRSPNTTYLPPPKNKTAAARHVKVLK